MVLAGATLARPDRPDASRVDIVIVDGIVTEFVAVSARHPSPSSLYDGAEIVDLDGRYVLPGLRDHRVRFDAWSRARYGETPRETETATDDEVVNAARRAAARGVTGIVDESAVWNLDVWAQRAKNGNNLLRVDVMIPPHGLGRAVSEGLSTGDVLPHTHGLVRVGPHRLVWSDPVATLTGMAAAAAAGIDVAVTARATADGSAIARLFERTGAHGGVDLAVVAENDLAALARVPVTLISLPPHPRMAAAGRAGARITLGSGAPAAPLDPWVSLAAAVFGAATRMPVAAALAASTATGSADVAPGDVADLVITEHDPYRASAEELASMPVTATLVNGRFTHRLI
ncbi:hypothetical protein GCM10027416_14670 [Okibacterium endophyticum]